MKLDRKRFLEEGQECDCMQVFRPKLSLAIYLLSLLMVCSCTKVWRHRLKPKVCSGLLFNPCLFLLSLTSIRRVY